MRVETVEEAVKVVRFYRGECQMLAGRFRDDAPEKTLFLAAARAAQDIEHRLEHGGLGPVPMT
jgi:hypothetical protein